MKAQRAAFWPLVSAVAMIVTITSCSKTPFDPQVQVAPASGISPARATESLSAQRPFSDFLSAQGTTTLFFPPFPDFIAWANNPQTLFAAVDYTGLVSQYLATHGGPDLGTTVDGTVSERRLPDGRAEVTVIVHAKNAMSWACGLPGDIVNDPTQFGYRQWDLLADPSLTPGTSTVNMKVVFTNDAPGAPLPDLVTAFIMGNATPGQTLLSMNFRADGTGPLHASGGWAEGTAGKMTISQTGLVSKIGSNGAVADGFPAEIVKLQAVGRGVFMN